MGLEKLNGLFEGAARELGFADGAKLDERGGCTLRSQTRGMPPVHLRYDERNDLLDVFAEIGHVPDDRQDLYREFLCDNLFGRGTKGATFAASKETGRIVLQRSVAVEPIGEASFLAAVLADFAEVAYAARQRLFATAESAASDEPSADSGFMRV